MVPAEWGTYSYDTQYPQVLVSWGYRRSEFCQQAIAPTTTSVSFTETQTTTVSTVRTSLLGVREVN